MNRVTSGVAHFRGLAPGQRSYEETSQRWRAVEDAVWSGLTGPRIEPQTSRTDSNVLNNSANQTVGEVEAHGLSAS